MNTVDKMQSRSGAQALSRVTASAMPADAECQHLLECSVAPQGKRNILIRGSRREGGWSRAGALGHSDEALSGLGRE